jgi:hypothetical protein
MYTEIIVFGFVAVLLLVFAAIGAVYMATDATPMFELARTCEQHGFIQNESYRIECSVVWRDK